MRLWRLLVLVAIATAASAQDLHGGKYQSLSAPQKAEVLSKLLYADTLPNGYFSTASMASQLLLENMDTSFDTEADDMPTQFIGLEYRKKVIHSVGVHAMAQWVSVPNKLNYTGVFASGAKNVLVRLSSAFKPIIDNTNTTAHIGPGLSIKVLIDGLPSVNLFALNSLSGQISFNFFAHDLSNHIPDLPSTTSQVFKIVRDKFATASDFPVMGTPRLTTLANLILPVGLSHFALHDEHGTKVGSPNFPFRVIFHPTSQWHSAFPNANPNVPFYEQLSKSLTSGPLYEIYAVPTPISDSRMSDAVRIGTLVLTGEATTSKFGDSHLFYEHARMEDDLNLRPEWKQSALDIMTKQGAMKTQYLYPDLPWK